MALRLLSFAALLLGSQAIPNATNMSAADDAYFLGLTDPVERAIYQGKKLPICRAHLFSDHHWSDWSNCSALCGTGMQTASINDLGSAVARYQKCYIQMKSRPCEGTFCPQDCVVSDWGNYSLCDQGTGKQYRTREILLSTQNGGRDCPPLTDVQNCAVDCVLSDWGPFSACDPDTGVKSTQRTILFPALNNGSACGALEQSVDCDVGCAQNPWGPWSACNPITGNMSRDRQNILASSNSGASCQLHQEVACVVDCSVGSWSDWGACSPSGDQTRNRSVIYPELNGGVPCDVATFDTDLQESQTCSVDCEMSDWEDWLPCNNATATRTRSRIVTQYPKNSGAECGQLQDYESCAVECQASPWSDYGPCDPNTGYTNRTRSVLVPAQNSGTPCQLIESNTCPVDAVVGPWGSWSDCATHGDDKGSQVRHREILVTPKNGGADAPSLDDQQDCNVDCVADEWQNWSPCDQINGTRSRTRTILATGSNGGQNCATIQTENCPVDCLVSDWSALSECNAINVQTRSRQVLTPALNGGTACPPLEENIECNVQCQTSDWSQFSNCDTNTGLQTRTRNLTDASVGSGSNDCPLTQTVACAVSCVVSNWGTWDDCATFGNNAGSATRKRIVVTPPLNGGARCPHLNESRKCDVDCQVGAFGEFGPCDPVTGLQWCQRIVTVMPLNNGKPCPPLQDSQDCRTDCRADTWGDWSDCDITTGNQTRQRAAQPLLTGANCTTEETINCPVSCEVTSWGQFSDCDPNTGFKTRSRIIKTLPLNNGIACPILSEQVYCPVDCETTGYLPWSACDSELGTQIRYANVTVTAKNGGNDDCAGSQVANCAVDCYIAPDGNVTVTPKNGGKSCYTVALALLAQGVQISPEQYNQTFTVLETSVKTSNNKVISLSGLAATSFGTLLLVGLFVTRRSSGRGYETIGSAV